MNIRSVSLLLFLLGMCQLSAQPQQHLAQAQQLSKNSQYLASNVFLNELIRMYPERKYDVARAFFLQSYNHLQLGDYTAASAANEQSLQLREQLSMDDTAENYMRRGVIWRELGDYHRALAALFQARNLPIDDASLYALISAYTATVYSAMGDVAKAKLEYTYAEESLRIAFGDQSEDLAVLYYDMGNLFLGQNQLEEAAQYLHKAKSILESLGRRPDMLARVHNALGQYQTRSDDPQTALRYYQQALDILRRGMVTDYPEAARIRINLAQELMQIENRPAAMQQVDSAIQLLSPSLAFGELPQPQTLSIQPLLSAQSLSLKSELLQYADDLMDVKQSYPVGRTAVLLLARYLSSLSDESSRLIAQEAVSTVFGQAIDAAMELSDRYGETAYAAEALGIAEMSKGYSLRNLITARNNIDPGLKTLQVELNSLRIRYALHPQDQQLTQDLQTQLIRWDDALRRQVYPTAMQASIYEHDIPDLARLRQPLDDRQALISYYVGEEYYYIFCLQQDRFTSHRLRLSRFGLRQSKHTALGAIRKVPVTSGGIYSRVDQFDTQVKLEESVRQFTRAIRKADIETFVYEGGMLYGNLLSLLESEMGGVRHLLISPHAYLHSLPFAALLPKYVDKEKDQKNHWHKLSYLMDNYDLSYTYSALYTSNHWHGAPQQLLALAPLFEEQALTSEAQTLFDTSSVQEASLRSTSPDGKNLAALPYSKAEVQSIAELFIDFEVPVQVLLGAEASEANLRYHLAGSRYLHLATHGFINYAKPHLSGIALAPMEGQLPDQDGMLFAGEIYDLNLQGQTVIISACDSGLGEDIGGEGPLSPARAFLAAGAAEVICTLWQVYDRPTAQLMERFYEVHLKGKSVAESLRQAQRKMAHDRQTANPRFWAGFVRVE